MIWMKLSLLFWNLRHISGACLVYSNIALNILNFHLLDHVVVDLYCFGTVSVLTASHYDHFNLVFKQSYPSTSDLLQTIKTETVQRLDTALCRQKFSTICDHPTPNITSFARLCIMKSGETLPFKALLVL